MTPKFLGMMKHGEATTYIYEKLITKISLRLHTTPLFCVFVEKDLKTIHTCSEYNDAD